MGADMLIAAIAVPADRSQPLDFDAGRGLIQAITDAALFEFDDPESQLEDLVDDFDPAVHLDADGSPTLDVAKGAGERIIDELQKALDSRDTTFITVAGYRIYVSGGLSWGDAPTEAADAIWHAYHLPKIALRTMGFIPDYTRPLSRTNGNPGPITDTDVVDAIALGLGTKSEWSSDELEWIPQLIDRRRPGIIGEEPADALKAFRELTSSDPLTCNFLIQYVSEDADEPEDDQDDAEDNDS